MKLNFIDFDNEEIECIKELAPILDITLSCDGYPVKTSRTDGVITVQFDDMGAEIGYGKKVEFCRALGLLKEVFDEKRNVVEKPEYSELSVMYDNSRNAVFKVETVKKLLRHLSLMGYTSLMLYTEDTYEIEGYPYFGYMRGRFTADELREIDDYAFLLGIEVIPCIQTLAHLAQALRWPSFSKINDCYDILLVGEEKTYELIDAMFRTVRGCLRSKRIHVGMDEAAMLGNGKYLAKNGYHERWNIMLEHLSRVTQIADKYGYTPIMWSDMFFNAAFHEEYYYAASLENPHIPEKIINTVPKQMQVVYWDYGNSYPIYNKMMKLHNEFANPVWFAGGATKWAGYAPMNQFSIKISREALKACRENKIKNIIVTAWGDNGGECSSMSVFPTLQMYAEDCYENNNSDEFVSKRFATCVNASYEDFLILDTVNFTPDNPAPGCGSRNPTKYFLHQDIMMGLFDKHLDSETFPKHFSDRAHLMREAGKRNTEWNYIFEALAALCDVLVLKTDVGVRLKEAYECGNQESLRLICDETLPEILRLTEQFIEKYRAMWLEENKIFGLEIIEIRLGGLERRIKTAMHRINEYLTGETKVLPELEEERLYFDCRVDPDTSLTIGVSKWGPIVSGSPINDI